MKKGERFLKGVIGSIVCIGIAWSTMNLEAPKVNAKQNQSEEQARVIQLKEQYQNGTQTEEEIISELLEQYGVKEYISKPTYNAAWGKKYDPQEKTALLNKVAKALIEIKGGGAYIDKCYKEYETRYANNYYDRNKFTHTKSYNVRPVDNPEKIARENYTEQLVAEEMGKMESAANAMENTQQSLAKAVYGMLAGILIGILARRMHILYKRKAWD